MGKCGEKTKNRDRDKSRRTHEDQVFISVYNKITSGVFCLVDYNIIIISASVERVQLLQVS